MIRSPYIVVYLFSSLIAFDARAEASIVIALNVATTGIEIEGDQGIINGARLAVEKANQNGGLKGKQIVLQIIDNKGTDLGARNAAITAAKGKAIAMIGAGRSSRSLVAAQVAQAQALPMITPFSTHPEITKVGDFIFRVGFTDELQGLTLGAYAAKQLKASRVVIVENASEEYSTILADQFEASFKNFSGSIVYKTYYFRKTLDFSKVVSEIKPLSYDLIFMPGYSKRSALFVKKAKELGLDKPILGGDGWGLSMYSFAGNAMNGNYSADHWHSSIGRKESLEFFHSYQERFSVNHVTSTGAALAFDAVNIIFHAAKKTKNLNKVELRKSLSNMDAFKGVTGVISFNKYGDPKNKPIIITKFIQNSKKLVRAFTYESP